MTQHPAGVALVVAVVVLAVLSSMLAALSIRITMVKHCQSYRIEYQRARYALDSALKYTITMLPNQKFAVAPREGLPDFSDLFWMSEQQYALFLQNWVSQATDEQVEKVFKEGVSLESMAPLSMSEMLEKMAGIFGVAADDPNASTTGQESTDPDTSEIVAIDPNDIEVPGPYGPPWPYVIKPIELEIGPAKVTITIEDENAKLPLAWAITNKDEINKQSEAVLATFGAWMAMDKTELMTLQSQLNEIYQYKVFELNPSPILLPQPRAATPTRQTRSTRSRRTRRTRTQTTPPAAQTQPQVRPAIAHATDFAKLFHSGLLDRESLARSVGHTALPNESALKYLALWGSQRVNVNTAPRHVLEAALTFGGDPVELTEKIIQKRQEKPIESIDELKKIFYGESQIIEQAKDYLTTTSNFFKIRVVSQSGNARASAVLTVIKEGKNVERLAILYGH